MVFESLSLDPKEASSGGRMPKVSRARVLTASVWVERLGNSQVSLADALRVSPEAVTNMVRKLRTEGLKKEETQIVTSLLLLENGGAQEGGDSDCHESVQAVAQ